MMEFTIEKEFAFSASHQLGRLPKEHQCARLHGHNYVLKVFLGGQFLNNVGFLVDYGDLGFVKEWVDALDHRHLNDMFDFNPTSELICAYYVREVAKWVRQQELDHIDYVRVALSETPKTWAWAGVWMEEFDDASSE